MYIDITSVLEKFNFGTAAYKLFHPIKNGIMPETELICVYMYKWKKEKQQFTVLLIFQCTWTELQINIVFSPIGL